ncbi:hypothetical protein OG226_32050 [Streptomyces sp. NBC_01261]|uniref:hypothetical protein n=1 Tax=Streptomyces sp. NBC_01261 TaxID=2903802 RepID=UPI002E304387|nr:hypothetical protein [Streptomyces sp. NBC_01261]
MRVLVGCWREAAGGFGAVLGTVEMLRVALGQDGITWAEAGEDVVLWAAVSVVWAVVTSLSLRRRARTVGVAFTPDVLADRQTRQLRALQPSVGWSDRMGAELKASDRVAVTAEKGREEIWFRWRPGRHGHTVWGSITFDEPSGTVLLDLREGEAYTGISGVRRGVSFVALCQLAQGLGLVEAEACRQAGQDLRTYRGMGLLRG